VLGRVDGSEACRFRCNGLGCGRLERLLRRAPLAGFGVKKVLRRLCLRRNQRLANVNRLMLRMNFVL